MSICIIYIGYTTYSTILSKYDISIIKYYKILLKMFINNIYRLQKKKSLITKSNLN